MRTAKTNKILDLVNKPDAVDRSNPSVEADTASPCNPNLRIPNSNEIPEIYEYTPGFQLVNVGFLIINEQLGQIMERFNCCMCAKCAATVTSEALKRIPPIIVPVRRKNDAQKVNELAEKSRHEIIKVLTKAVITVKNNPKH